MRTDGRRQLNKRERRHATPHRLKQMEFIESKKGILTVALLYNLPSSIDYICRAEFVT
jgi:hypothetical protein